MRVSDPLPSLISSGFVHLLQFGGVDGCHCNTLHRARADCRKKNSAVRDIGIERMHKGQMTMDHTARALQKHVERQAFGKF